LGSTILGLILTSIAVALTAMQVKLAFQQLNPAPRELSISHRVLDGDGGRLTSVAVTNTGRHDIADAQFNNAAPIRLTFGAELLEIRQRSLSSGRSVPLVEILDGDLALQPSLIAVGERIEVEVKSAGPTGVAPPKIGHELIGVRVRTLGAKAVRQVNIRRASLRLVSSSIAAGLGLALVVWLAASFFSPPNFWITPSPVEVGSNASVCAQGLTPFDIVQVETEVWPEPPLILGSDQVDKSGSVCVTIFLPGDFEQGNSLLTVAVIQADGYSYYSMTISVVGSAG